MGHQALICRSCGTEWSLQAVREAGSERAPTCPECETGTFGT